MIDKNCYLFYNIMMYLRLERGISDIMKININDNNYLELPNGYCKIRNRAEMGNDGKMCGYQKMTENSNGIVLFFPIDEKNAMKLDDKKGLIADIHKNVADNQGVIEVETGETAEGYPYIYSLTKTGKITKGAIYFLRMNIEFSKGNVYEVRGVYDEIGFAGLRHDFATQMAAQSGRVGYGKSGKYGWTEDPYDKEFNKGLLMDLSENRNMDNMFKDNPLSQVRDLIEALVDSTSVKNDKAYSGENAFPENPRVKFEMFTSKDIKALVNGFIDDVASVDILSAEAENKLIDLYDAREEAVVALNEVLDYFNGSKAIPENLEKRVRGIRKSINSFESRKKIVDNNLKKALAGTSGVLPSTKLQAIPTIVAALGEKKAKALLTAFDSDTLQEAVDGIIDNNEPMVTAARWIGGASLIAESDNVSQNAFYSLIDPLPYTISEGVMLYSKKKGVSINLKYSKSIDRLEDFAEKLSKAKSAIDAAVVDASNTYESLDKLVPEIRGISVEKIDGDYADLQDDERKAAEKLCNLAEQLASDVDILVG